MAPTEGRLAPTLNKHASWPPTEDSKPPGYIPWSQPVGRSERSMGSARRTARQRWGTRSIRQGARQGARQGPSQGASFNGVSLELYWYLVHEWRAGGPWQADGWKGNRVLCIEYVSLYAFTFFVSLLGPRYTSVLAQVLIPRNSLVGWWVGKAKDVIEDLVLAR